jgi:hypothetical protein
MRPSTHARGPLSLSWVRSLEWSALDLRPSMATHSPETNSSPLQARQTHRYGSRWFGRHWALVL